MTGSREVYGVGGFLPDRPNGNVIEQTVDNGDGTGTRTTSGALRFGVRKDGGTDRSFTGSMSYGAVYNTDLSSARILAHAQAAGLA